MTVKTIKMVSFKGGSICARHPIGCRYAGFEYDRDLDSSRLYSYELIDKVVYKDQKLFAVKDDQNNVFIVQDDESVVLEENVVSVKPDVKTIKMVSFVGSQVCSTHSIGKDYPGFQYNRSLVDDGPYLYELIDTVTLPSQNLAIVKDPDGVVFVVQNENDHRCRIIDVAVSAEETVPTKTVFLDLKEVQAAAEYLEKHGVANINYYDSIIENVKRGINENLDFVSTAGYWISFMPDEEENNVGVEVLVSPNIGVYDVQTFEFDGTHLIQKI